MNSALRLIAATAVVACTTGGFAAHKASSNSVIDTGTFSIFVSGQRVATEKFEIRRKDNVSLVDSEVRIEGGTQKVALSSQMELGPTGDLLRYNFREMSPGKAEAVVEPSAEFLVEHAKLNPAEKPQDMPFLMPASTVILDDYFFAHRQLLAWRYLASVCSPAGGSLRCKSAPSQFGVIIPRQRTASQVTVAFVGREKVNVHGTVRDLNRLKLRVDDSDWSLWIDDQQHLVRILVPDQQLEVVRD
jgi:hypothetical protein